MTTEQPPRKACVRFLKGGERVYFPGKTSGTVLFVGGVTLVSKDIAMLHTSHGTFRLKASSVITLAD